MGVLSILKQKIIPRKTTNVTCKIMAMFRISVLFNMRTDSTFKKGCHLPHHDVGLHSHKEPE